MFRMEFRENGNKNWVGGWVGSSQLQQIVMSFMITWVYVTMAILEDILLFTTYEWMNEWWSNLKAIKKGWSRIYLDWFSKYFYFGRKF